MLAPAKAGEGSVGVVADIAKLSVGREEYYTRELATDHEQYLSGHGESPAGGTAPPPARSGWRAKHRRRNSRPCSRAGTRRRRSCWAVPMAATPCQPSTWSCSRPRACRSSTGWVTRPPAGRSWLPITLGWPRRSATWTSTWGPAVAMAVSGRLWHGRHLLAPTLRAADFEADQAAWVLPDPGVAVVPIVAVHGAPVPWGKVVTDGVPVVAAGACQACFVPSRRCWGPSGSPGWPTRPGSASTPPPDPCGLPGGSRPCCWWPGAASSDWKAWPQTPR